MKRAFLRRWLPTRLSQRKTPGRQPVRLRLETLDERIVPAAPVAIDMGITAQSLGSVFTSAATDPDTPLGSLTYTFTSGSAGSFSASGSSITYTAASGFVGKDKAEYTVSDGTDTDTGWIYVDVGADLPAGTISTACGCVNTGGSIIGSALSLPTGDSGFMDRSVRASDGTVRLGVTDLETSALGESWGITPTGRTIPEPRAEAERSVRIGR